jgi:hypothetical protein
MCALVEPLIVEENVMFGVIMLQNMFQGYNCLWGSPRVPVRTE